MFFYSIGENIKNIIALMYTKLIWKNARLVRLPFYARNQRNIIMSKGFTCGYNCRLSAGSDIVGGKIIFGKNFTMGDNCQLERQGGLTIGDDVLLASRVFIGTTSHGINMKVSDRIVLRQSQMNVRFIIKVLKLAIIAGLEME